MESNGRINVKLNGNYFVRNKVVHPNNNNVVNIYIVYKLDQVTSLRNIDYTIQNALFGAMNITKNVSNSSKNKHEACGICFDSGGEFSIRNITNGGKVLIFGADMASSIHNTNKANNIYVLGKDFVQEINDTTLYAEKLYKTNFTETAKKYLLSLHYNLSNSYLFVNRNEELKFKSKVDQIVKEKLCLGNLSADWTASASELQKTWLYGNVHDFVVDYQAINGVKTIYNMHRYLMDKHEI